MTTILIAIFGMTGVLARYALGVVTAHFFDQTLPIATFCINILGSFLIGAAYVAGIERMLITEPLRLGLMVGFLGGFTTFSAYSLEVVRMIEMNRLTHALAYATASTVLGVLATMMGFYVARRLFGMA